MLLFKPEHIKPILEGRKTQTRRRWAKARAKVGAVHQAKTRLFGGEPFARLKITAVWQERLSYINEADARAEGYASIREYREVFERIYGPASWERDPIVWVVDFRLEES